MGAKSQKENETAAGQSQLVHEECYERCYETEKSPESKVGATVDPTLLDLDPKKFKLIHETFQKRTYQEAPLKVGEPAGGYIEGTGKVGHLIHEIVIKRCYMEVEDWG